MSSPRRGLAAAGTMCEPVQVRYTSVEELKRDMAHFDPAVMCIRNTLPGKGVPAGWQLKDMSKRQLGQLLSEAYREWPGEVLLEFEAPPDPDEFEGLSPRSADGVRLANAAFNGEMEEVVRLVESRVDPDLCVKEKGFNTALNLACRSGHKDIIKYLFSRRADPNARNDFKETPLLCAANRARADVCQMLLEQRADVHAMDENGDNALDFLGIGNSDRKRSCREVLRQYGCTKR